MTVKKSSFGVCLIQSAFTSKCQSYEEAVERLKELFVKKPNQIFAQVG